MNNMFPFNNGGGEGEGFMPTPTPVVKKKRRSRKKIPVPLSPEAEKQERELRAKIQQSLCTQQECRKKIEVVDDETYQHPFAYDNNNTTTTHYANHRGGNTAFTNMMLSGGMGIQTNRGMNTRQMGMQQEYQPVQANDLFNQMNTISSQEGVQTNRGMNTRHMGMQQEYQQVQANDLFNQMNTISSQEVKEVYQIGQVELQSYELKQRLKQEKEMGTQQMITQVELQNYELEKTLEQEMTIRQQQQVAQTSFGENNTLFQHAGQARDYRNQQQQSSPQQRAQFLRQQQHLQQLLTLHPYLYDGQLPFSVSQRGFMAMNANNVRQSDGPYTVEDGVARQAMDYVGQHLPICHQCQQYDTSLSTQQDQQTEVPVMHKSAGDSTIMTFSSSITESWLKGSMGNDYAFNSVGEDMGSGMFDNSMSLSAMFSERELKNYDEPSQSEDEVSKAITSINSSGNNDNTSGRRKRSNTDTKFSAMAEISKWTKEVCPFEAVVQSDVKNETEDGSRSDTRSGTTLLSSESTQPIWQTNKIETNILLLPIHENDVSESDSNKEIDDSALSNNFDGNLSMDSKMLEDLLKKSGQSQDMLISNFSLFNSTGEGEASSPSIQMVGSRKSSSRSSKSSKSSTRSSSIMSEITQWSKDNPFEASENDNGSNEVDLKENKEKYDISCSGLSLL